MRSRKWLSIVGLAGLVAGGCGKPAPDAGDGVVVGVVLPLSGVDAETGREVLRGLRLAAERSSPPITLRPLDGEGTALASARRLRELARDPQVDVVVGGWLASTARTLAAVSSAEELPFVGLSPLGGPSPGAGGTDLFLLHRLASLGQASAVFAREDLGTEQAGVLVIGGSTVSRILGDAFRREFAAAGGQVAWTVVPDEQGRITLPRGPETKVDALYVAGPSEWAERCLTLARRSRGAAVLLADGWSLSSVETLVERDFPVYLAGFFSETDPAPPVQALLAACAAAEVPPNPATALGWDALRLVEAAAARGGPSRDGVRAALRTGGPIVGASGAVGHAIPIRTRETPAISSAAGSGFVFIRRVEVAPPAPPPGA